MTPIDERPQVQGQSEVVGGEARVTSTELTSTTVSADTASVRASILRRFEVWLDEILASEGAPAGIGAEILAELESDAGSSEAPDLVALWSAMMRMAKETRDQGQSFRRLQEELKPVQTVLDSVSSQRQSDEVREQERQRLVAAEREQLLDEVVELLLDMREHLTRGADSARQARGEMPLSRRGGLVQRLSAKPMAQADGIVTTLMKGYDLCREELDKALSQYGVRPIECVGAPFDASRMKAVDRDETGNVVDGTVTAICRQGYLRHGKVHRPAEVRVARRPATEASA